jgi:cell division protein FtsW (lipid II flippase)
MKNRPSSHLLMILLIAALQIAGYLAVYRGALLRGYETSLLVAVRDLLLFIPVAAVIVWLSRNRKYGGDWSLFTAAILLFSIGMVVQYRLYNDPEYLSRNKAVPRTAKTEAMRTRFLNEFYDPQKKRIMGITRPLPVNTANAQIGRTYSVGNILFSSYTWIPVISLLTFALFFILFTKESTLSWIQKHSFIIVLLTIVPLSAAVATSEAGKALGNMTPWEPSKIPFLLGFAGVLTALYKDLARTYWGVPRAKDVVPLIVMALIPFIPFFALKDFGQMLVFSGAYATLYLVAVRRWPQLFLFVGSIVLAISILVVGALPPELKTRVPMLATLSSPIYALMPARIQQRFHLWIDGFNPPSPETSWWRRDFNQALEENPEMKRAAETSSTVRSMVNTDIWFDRLAFQPSQALFGLASGGLSGRGLGLGYPEVVPVADSDYIYAAISEELGLFGGLVVILALIVFVAAGIRVAMESRDMFSKLCAAGLTAFIGLQAIVNIGGITRALPMTGITLPFVSHGGFSLLTSFAMLGMLMALSQRNLHDVRTTRKVQTVNTKPALEAVR